MYIRACNQKGCSNQSSGNLLKIDTKAPTVTAKASSNAIVVGTNNKSIDYFNVSYSISGGTTSCSPASVGALAVGTHNVSCTATGGNGLKTTATISLKVNPAIPSTPTLEARYGNANGTVYSGAWTNNNVYVKINPGTSSDIVTSYQYKVGNGSWSSPSWLSLNNNIGSFTYSSEIEGTIYVRACNGSKCSDASAGLTLKIDKTAPTCTLNVKTSGISIKNKSSDVTSSGVNNSSNPNYTNASLRIGYGTFYGFVLDRAGNTGSCSVHITDTKSERDCATTCSPGSESCSYTCYYNASSSEISRKKCSSGAYEPTHKTCYVTGRSECPYSHPYIDWSASRCTSEPGTCSETCSTSYYCSSGYTKLNSSYCYK